MLQKKKNGVFMLLHHNQCSCQPKSELFLTVVYIKKTVNLSSLLAFPVIKLLSKFSSIIVFKLKLACKHYTTVSDHLLRQYVSMI